MDDLIAWLRAQLDEDRADLLNLDAILPDDTGFPRSRSFQLDEVEGKRRILDAYDPERDKVQFPSWDSPTCSDNCGPDVWHEVVRHLSAAYRDRPGYRKEWAPND